MVDSNSVVAKPEKADNFVPKTRKPRIDGQKESFEIDARIHLMVDFDLCVELGEHVVKHGTDNPALYALGIRLKKMGD